MLALNEADLSILSIEQQETVRTLRVTIHSLDSEMRLPLAAPPGMTALWLRSWSKSDAMPMHVLHVFQKKAKSGIITSQPDGQLIENG